MPLIEAKLAKWCHGSAGLCDGVELNCDKCVGTIHREIAERRRNKDLRGKRKKGEEPGL